MIFIQEQFGCKSIEIKRFFTEKEAVDWVQSELTPEVKAVHYINLTLPPVGFSFYVEVPGTPITIRYWCFNEEHRYEVAIKTVKEELR